MGLKQNVETHIKKTPKERHELDLIAHKEESSFRLRGVEILYTSHRHAVKNAMQIQKDWCMDNVCSRSKSLDVMCKKKRKGMDRFEIQECDWCWNEQVGAGKIPAQKDEISQQCDAVSRHSFVFLMVIYALLVVLALAIMTLLIVRTLQHRETSKRAVIPGEPADFTHRDRSHQPPKYWPSQWISSRAKHPKSADFSDPRNTLDGS